MLKLSLTIFSFIFISITYTYFLASVCNNFKEEKFNFKKYIICFGIILLHCIINKYLMFPLNTILSILTYGLCSYFIFKVEPLKSLFIATLFLILLAIVELVSVYSFMFAFNKSITELLGSNLFLTIVLVLQCTIIMGITKLFSFLLNRHESSTSFFRDLKFSQIKTFLIISILCIFPQMLIFVFNKYNYSISFLIINSIQMMIFCTFIFVFLKRSNEYEKTQNELRLSELHNKTMISMVDGVRILKHDFNNIIQALSGYVSTKQYDKLEEHINSVMQECTNINNLSAITPELFNDPAIYGIVGAKYFIATEKEITIDLDITSNIKEINFSMPDLSRVLGILLDNSIEATSQINNKYIKLEIKYDFKKNADIIRIINTFDNSSTIEVDRIFDKGFSTKAIKSGLGLWEVKRIIKKFSNSQIFSAIENNKFIQSIIIEK